MAASRSVRTNKKGQQVVTVLVKMGLLSPVNLKRVKTVSASKLVKLLKRTTASGGTIKKSSNAKGRKKVTRTKEDGRSTTRSTSAKGKVAKH